MSGPPPPSGETVVRVDTDETPEGQDLEETLDDQAIGGEPAKPAEDSSGNKEAGTEEVPLGQASGSDQLQTVEQQNPTEDPKQVKNKTQADAGYHMKVGGFIAFKVRTQSNWVNNKKDTGNFS